MDQKMLAQESNKSKEQMLKNAGYLFLVQGVNYVFPLITLPYLTYKLGIKGFGIYAFAQVVIQYIQVVTDYGFNLTATRKLATAQNNPNKVAEIFWLVLTAKVILGILATIIGTIFLAIFSPAWPKLYIYSFFAIWGSIFFPIWYFQGMELMQKIAWINVVSKCVGIAILFFMVNGPDDIPFAGLAQSAPFICSAIIASWVIYKSNKIFKIKVTWRGIKSEFSDGRDIFMTSFFSAALANSGIFALGVYHSAEIVGVFAASERIVKAVVGCFSPITQAIYPNNAKAFSRSKQEGFEQVKITGFYVIGLAAFAASFFWFFAPYIAKIFHWQEGMHVHVLRLLSPWLFLSIANNVLGIQILTAMGNGAIYSKVFMIASAVLITILVFGAQKYNVNAVLVSMNAAEAVLTALLIFVVRNKWKSK